MRRPSPEVLDLFYRSGGYPIDDLDVRDSVQHTSSVIASTWFVPTRTIPAVFFIMGGGSGDLSALIYELRRLAEITSIMAAALNWPEQNRTLARGLCYHYYIQVTHLDSRVYSKAIEPWDDALTPLVHASVLHPWFQPVDRYEDVYRVGYIQSINLPIVEFDTSEEAEFLGDPDAPVAKLADVRELRKSQQEPALYSRPALPSKKEAYAGAKGGINPPDPLSFVEQEGGEQAVQRLSDMRLSDEDRAFLDLPSDIEDDL
jgi:hypothetical protein